MSKSTRCDFLMLVLITVFAALQGCASGPGYTSGYEYVEPYKKGGHFFTVYYVTVVSEGAGIDVDRANRLTCYAQSPDEISAYNAVPVSFKNMFYDWGYRHDVVNSLHSLHGGDTDAVNYRRKTLQKLITQSLKEGPNSDWKTGFMIHALGDSYAHVKGDYDSPKAFGEGVGHLFASIFGPDPDNVYVGENYKEFDAYIQALYAALADPSNSGYEESRKRLQFLVERIKNDKGKLNKKDEAFIKLLVSITKDPLDESVCSQLNSQLDDAQVRAFLSKLTAELFYVAPEA